MRTAGELRQWLENVPDSAALVVWDEDEQTLISIGLRLEFISQNENIALAYSLKEAGHLVVVETTNCS